MPLRVSLSLLIFCSLFPAPGAQSPESTPAKPVRLAIAGLVHGHVDGFLFRPIQQRKDVEIVGIFEPAPEVREKYAKKYGFAPSVFYTDLKAMLEKTKPDAVATFTNTFDHAMVVETSAPLRIPVMMEKPLAVSNNHAQRIQRAAAKYQIPVIVNYETSWYGSHAAIWNLVKQQKAIGEIRKMVAMDGHQGPKEINVGPEFLGFLTDAKLNGAGALFDFGCYGANLMTWLMDNERPVSVTALTKQMKPAIYPKVDDDATILVEYPKAEGIIQGSWNWPFSRKDFEVYGATGYAIATGGNRLTVRVPEQKAEESRTPDAMPTDEHDPLSYLIAVIHGKKVTGLSSLDNNVIAVEILDAARESAKTGKRVALPARHQ
jgi:predicted dehydrogenase